jgi:hypothetical protein
MNMPGFTAEQAAYRTTARYARGRYGTWTQADRIQPAGNCGPFCNCDPGQCCKMSGFGTCSCNSCLVEEVRMAEPAFLRA